MKIIDIIVDKLPEVCEECVFYQYNHILGICSCVIFMNEEIGEISLKRNCRRDDCKLIEIKALQKKEFTLEEMLDEFYNNYEKYLEKYLKGVK